MLRKYLFFGLLISLVGILGGCGLSRTQAGQADQADQNDTATVQAAQAEQSDTSSQGSQAAQAEQSDQASPETGRAIVVADISDDPAGKIERFQPLADYLGRNLAEFGITHGEVKIASDMETMIVWMKTGQVDLFYDSPFPAMMISDGSGAQPIMRRWKDGVSEYHSVFFARADSHLTELADLQGQVIGFEEPFSTSGYMLPLAHLKEAGFKVEELSSRQATPAADTIGYVFTGDDDNTVQWVLGEQLTAGVTDSEKFAEIPGETRQQLVVLAETEAVARQVVLARPDMDPAMIEAVQTLMADLNETTAGQEILITLKTDQFDMFPDGAESTFTRMHQLFELIQAE